MEDRIISKVNEVLIVEDSPTQSDNLKYMLQGTGMQVVQSYNGSEALTLMKSIRPDLIITDVMMPEMNGIDLCTHLKNNPDLRDIPVIILTTLDSVDDILTALAAGADGYVMKPYNRTNLLSGIQQVIDNREILKSGEEEEHLQLTYNGKNYVIHANGAKILSMLFTSYESAKMKSADLKEKKEELLVVSNLLKSKIEKRKSELGDQLDKIRDAGSEIRKSEKRYIELIEYALTGIFILDKAGNIVQTNLAFLAMLGKDANREEPISSAEIFESDETWQGFRDALHSKQSVAEFETRLKHEKGEKIVVSVNAFLDEGEISCVVTDITEQKKEEEQLKEMMEELINAKEKAAQSESVKTSFLANMSDRILQPVKVMLKEVEQVGGENLAGENLRFQLNEIIDIGNYLSNLIDSTIDVAMLEAAEAKFRLDDCFINQLLIDIFADQQKKLEEKGMEGPELRLRRQIKDTGFMIRSEDYRLKRIFQTLLENSFKYTQKGIIEFGYKIYAQSSGKEGVLLFYVKDTGAGMPEQKVRHIFDRFGSGEEEGRRNDYHAAGLGLSLSRGYVEMLGGRIWCESEPEKGTGYFFTHPVENSDAVRALSSEKLATRSLKMITQGKKVLLTEHIDEQYELLISILEPLNMVIERAVSGKDLVDQLKSGKKYDLLFVNLKSSIVTGQELVTEIRRLNNKVPVIVRSTFFSDEETHLLREFGCDHLVTKPVDPKVLFSMIGSLL